MFFNTLSGRVLGLTVVFVVVAEVLIFVPAVARFRETYLQGRLDLAQLAALAQLATPPDDEVAPKLQSTLLENAGVLNVVLRRQGVRELVLSSPVPLTVADFYDITAPSWMQLIHDALKVFVTPEDRVIQVIGLTGRDEKGVIEVTMHQGPLREAMIAYGLRVLYLSLLISAALAALLFFAVQRLVVRPIGRVVDHMTAYRDNPEDATRFIAPESGAREIRQAEVALHDLQVQLTAALRHKERLAGLGGAVAKISHDLRNLLTTAQLLADRIEASSDPKVRSSAPKLVSSLARAIALCERTLAYGKAEEPPPVLAVFPLGPLVAEVVENETQAADAGLVKIAANCVPDMRVRANSDQLFRVLTNLVRNAAQAIEATGRPGIVTVAARAAAGSSEICVTDTGPGLPPKAKANLFQPFRGGVRQGGSGLGLVIAAELVKGHGGALTLADTGPGGTTFRLTLPAPPVSRSGSPGNH